MHLLSTAALTALALAASAPAFARDLGGAGGGEPALRLPGQPGVQAWAGDPSSMLHSWASSLTVHLTRAGLTPRFLPSAAPLTTEPSLRVERSRHALALNWRPWSSGAWSFGASMGLHRSLPGLATAGFAAMPVASYELPQYRMSVGLMPPHGDRAMALVLGLSLPLD